MNEEEEEKRKDGEYEEEEEGIERRERGRVGAKQGGR